VRQIGVGVGVAIIIDALIVRPVLLPAAVEVLGRWSWWPTGRDAATAPATTTAPPSVGVQPVAGD